jgi:hypothetical protein
MNIFDTQIKNIFLLLTLNNIGPYYDSDDTLIKFNHDANYLGDKFISLWQVIIALIYIVLCLL